MSAVSTRREVSTVHFERFEVEEDPKKEVWQRNLVQLATERSWLSPSAIDIFKEASWKSPRANPDEVNIQKKMNWWGRMHHALVGETLPQEMIVSFSSHFDPAQYFLKIYRHSFDWDMQSWPGSAIETVLHNTDREIAALKFDPNSSDVQRFVINGDEGWHEPARDEADRAKSMLFAMTQLALNQVNAHYVDNR